MKSNEERHHPDDDKLMRSTKGTFTPLPKLRKNKRLDKRWGQKYYTAVREAVFMVRETPYMPAQPPESIREEADDCQPLYVCKQCRDCFRFLSSLEAHNSRRSWILGYWCHNCFFIDCSHTQKGEPPCFDCQAINRERTTFLRAKGLSKGRKLGCIKIFYNQCQFFSHLKGHDTIVVDMGDVMLMPIPTDVDRESYAELEQLCETIMERMFLTRTHVMDWLRSQQLDNKWLRLLQSSSENIANSLPKILKTTRGTRRGRNSVKLPIKPHKTTATSPASPGSTSVTCPASSETWSSISETIESVIAQSICDETTEDKSPEMPPLSSITFINPLEPIEDEDNPCTTADIAFVDCGPAAKTYPPELAVILPAKVKSRVVQNGNASCNSIVKADSRPSLRMSGAPLLLKQRNVNNVVYTTPSSSASSAGPRLFEPKISVKKFASERLKTPPLVPCVKNYSNVNSQRSQTQSLRKLAPASKVRIPSTKTPLPSVTEIPRVVETSKKTVSQASVSTLGSKILTVHSPKNTDLSKIISQLPPDVISGKKIVFIGQDAERFTILPKNDTTTSSLGMIKIQSDNEKAKIIQTIPTKIAPMIMPNIGSEQSSRVASETSKMNPITDKIRPKIQHVYFDSKVIYQNGKKFIIRPARKPIPESTVCTNINNLKLQTIPKRVSLSSFLSSSRPPVTSYIPIAAKSIDTGANKVAFPSTLSPIPSASPSPSLSPSPCLSPSTSTTEDLICLSPEAQIKRNGIESDNVGKSADSSNTSESHPLTATTLCSPPIRDNRTSDGVEYFSIEINPAGKSCVDFSKIKKPICMPTAMNYKQQLIEKIRRLDAGRIKQQIHHLMDMNSEYSRMLGITDNAILSENLKAIKYLDNALNEKAQCSEQDRKIDQEMSDADINEILLNLQETRESPSICPTCNRSVKSESHILQFSKGSVKSPGCRSCNTYTCHICNVFQGNMSRFRAHLNYHAKKEPFTCPECFRKFPTFQRLENHTWTTCYHSLSRRWFQCRVCQVEGFLNMESVTKHFILAHSELKIACPECGIILQSRDDFTKHCEEDHSTVTDLLKPVNLMVCDVGHCVVRLEDYRSHMDHHMAVITMLYYKCSFCSFLVKALKRGRDQIRSHLYKEHLEKLSGIVSFENAPLDSVNESLASEDSSKCHQNPDIRDVSMSNSCSDKNDQGEKVVELEQRSDHSGCVEKNVEKINAKLDNQTLEDGVECSIWSINVGHTESPHSTDSGTDSLEIMTTVQEAAHTNHVISEYSSSPKIFDVRSVTPDSYAELDGVSKEQSDALDTDGESMVQSFSGISKEGNSEGFVAVKIFERPDQIVASEGAFKDSVLIKVGGQLLPMKLPQVIVIDQAKGNVNLSEMLQPTFTDSNAVVKSSDLTKLDEKSVAESVVCLGTETKEPCLPIIETVCTLARPSGSEQCTEMKMKILPASVLKSKNSSMLEIKNDINEVNNPKSDSHTQAANLSQNTTNSLDTCEENTKDSLLSDIPKPPPLARIPQRLLEVSEVNDKVVEEEPLESSVTTPRSLIKSKPRRKRPWRIALNAPICTSEVIIYHCHLCGELINTSWAVLANHFSSRHSQDYKLSIVTPRLLRMSSDFISEGYKEVLGSRKRKSDPIVSSSKRRRRWNPKKHIEKHALGPGLCVQQESVQDGEGNFICKKCDHQCNDIASLRIHIGTNHRIKDHYLVCLECGENFVVEPSLQMHLKAFHRIQDPCTYMAQNTAYIKEITETVENESNTGIANQCHVCMAVFEDKLAVDKHLRVHGMAFLNRKRIEAQNAARNPEKKSKIDKPDDSVAAVGQKNDKLENRKLGKIQLSVDGTVRES